MFWKLRFEDGPELSEAADASPVGRFVLDRHTDAGGEHFDLRLECDGHLEGWRIDGTSLGEELWATEKAPHPLVWLDEERDATREDAGVYVWEKMGPEGGVVVLQGREGNRRVRIERDRQFTAGAVRAIDGALAAHGLSVGDVARLLEDGVQARARAIERFCGLGHELDGSAFDEGVWRRTLSGLALDEINAQLRAFEVRFDLKYPPQPVSRPEVLGEDGEESREEMALSILRG